MFGEILVFFTLFISFFLIGYTCLYILDAGIEKFFSTIFSSAFLGILLFVITFSLIKTGGNTVNIGLLILLLILIYEHKKSKRNSKQSYLLSIWIKGNMIAFISVFVVLAFCYLFTHVNAGSPEEISKASTMLHRDFFWLANNSHYLSKSGNENIFNVNNILSESFKKNTPYHYFELWLNSGVSELVNILPIVSDRNIVLPLLLSIVIIGFASIAEHFLISPIQRILFAIISVFFLGLFFFDFLTFITKFKINALDNPKYTVQYIWIIACLLLFLNNRIHLAIVVLLMLPIASISTAPGIYGGVLVYLFHRLWKKTEIETIRLAGYVLFSFLFIVLFYYFQRENNSGTVLPLSSLNLLQYTNDFSVKGIKTMMYICLSSLLQLNIIYLPYSILFFYFGIRYRKIISDSTYISQLKQAGWLFLLIFMSALVSWSVLTKLQNSWELFTNIASASINIFIPLTVLFLVTNCNLSFKTISLLLVLFCIHCTCLLGLNLYSKSSEKYCRYDTSFISNVSSFTKTLTLPAYGALILSDSEDHYKARGVSQTLTYNLFNEGTYLSFMNPDISILPLFGLDDYLQYKQAGKNSDSLLPGTVFGRFVQNQIAAESFHSIGKSQKLFIDSLHLRFIIMSKGTKPEEEVAYLVDTLFTNRSTGEKFLVLKR